MGSSAAWGPFELARLQIAWNNGLTASQIAREFNDGRTRNSIIGKVHALGLPSRPMGRVKVGAGATARRKAGEAVGGMRKAYASKGDDVTLSRFVKVPGELRVPRHIQWAIPGLEKPHAAVDAGRSIFHKRGIRPPAPGLLVSGHSNVKIGRDVRKGAFRGYWIYTLSLEERATCPRACHHWRTCYGNNMPFAKRVDHRDRAALERAITADVERLLAVRGRAGILVRLHALGDFFDEDYVDFWANLLAKHERLAIYGYTAWLPDTQIGAAVDRVRGEYGMRFAVRYSNGGMATDCTVPIKSFDEPVNATICPEQTGKTAACATCALCWQSRRNIAFVEH